jgi:heme exporter protein A
MISALTIEKLACLRGERRLFEGLSFQLRAGQALSVEGANGAGKTSLLRIIAGFMAPAAGAIRITEDGQDIVDGELRGRRIGWMGHQDALKGPLTVAEQLSFYAKLYSRSLRPSLAQEPATGTSPASASRAGKDNLSTVLEQVGLTRQRELPCRYLSAGQKRRLGLARLLVCARPLWLLDEPFAALDGAGKSLVARLMIEHCGRGGMVLAATHEPLGLSNQSIRL